MKKLLSVVVLVLGVGFLFGSCNKMNEEKKDPIVGCWTEDYDHESIQWYCEFTKDGNFFDYELSGAKASYKDGVLYTPASATWVKNAHGKYAIVDGVLTIDGLEGSATIEFPGKDRFRLDGEDDYIRVKSFATK